MSGKNYFEYVRKHIYTPSGMIATDCYDLDQPVPNLAVGYSRQRTADGVVWRNNIFDHVVRGGPAGGGFSTVEDLFRFGRALLQGTLVRRETAELLWSPKPEVGSSSYGYGFGIEGTSDNRIVGHGGGFLGLNARFDLHVDSGCTVVVLANRDLAAEPVRQKAIELLARAR